MVWEHVSDRWDHFAARARQQWSKLTRADTATVGGRRWALASRIRERYGVAQEDADNQIECWMRTLPLAATGPRAPF